MAKSTGNKLQQLIDEQVGRVPPHDIEIEQAVLGALLILDDAEQDYASLLKPEVFYKEEHQKIYRAIEELMHQNQKVDLYTVKDQLIKDNVLEEVGGLPYLTRLTFNVGSAAHLDYHVKILVQKYIQRELIKITADLQNKAYDAGTDVVELLDEAESALFQLAYGSIHREALPFDSVLKNLMDELKRIEQRQDGLTGVPSGYPSLDRVTGGWQNSDLIIIAARPSMGKTAFVVNIARNLAVLQGIPVAFFTLEMPAEQIAMRILSIESEISSNKIRTGNITDQEWIMLEEKVQLMENAPLFIDDTPQLSLFELRAKTRRLVSNHHVQLIIVDYLQLMTVAQENRMNREQVVSQISRGLKAIAKELKVPVIALSQLNRSVELRGGSKRPQLSDLRESGAIEQDADLVIFLHRPEYYGITQDAEGNSYEGIAEIIISKHRNGPLADIKLRYIKEYGKFEEIEGEQLQDINEDVEVQIISSKMNSEDVGELPDLGSSTDSLDFAPNEGFDQQFDDSDQIDHGDIPF